MLKALRYFDWPLFAAVLILSVTGLMMIYSTGLGGGAEGNLWVIQTVALAIGLAGLLIFASLDYRLLKKASSLLFVLSVVLLLGVLFFGLEIRGSERWLNLGFFNFQPAEFSKFALIVILAKFIPQRGLHLQKFKYVAWSACYAAIPLVLVMLQPDLGSAVLHLLIWLGLILLSPMPKRYFLYLVVLFLVISAVSWQFFLQDYQQDRVRSFLNPTADPLGRGYNVIQSIVAVGSGGLFGQGLARGLQSQLRFLPERQTDFIFASTVEELGILGGGLVLLLLLFVLYRMLKITTGSRDLFGTYLGGGIFFLFLAQTVINIGMNLGLLPVTGITLPFLSYGGSSLVITLWLVGIMENISRHSVLVRFA